MYIPPLIVRIIFPTYILSFWLNQSRSARGHISKNSDKSENDLNDDRIESLYFRWTQRKLINFLLKVQSCKLYNDKYMIASSQISNIEDFAFVAVPVFTLLSRKVLFIDKKDNRDC